MRILLICCLIILNNNLFGQEFYFKNIGTAQGLPSSETYHSLQDSKGYIWITTDAGICKYDGKSITTYTTKDGLPENVVFNVYEDRHGRIWFNSLSGYIYYYENKRFHLIGAYKELLKFCNKNIITSFFIGENDTLYCSANSFLFKIPSQNNYKIITKIKVSKCTAFMITNKSNKKDVITCSGMEKPNKLSESFSLYSFDNNKKTTIKLKQFSYYATKILALIDIHQNVYISINKQLSIMLSKDNSIEFHYLPSDIIFVKQDKDRNLWIGTKNGGYFYGNSDFKSKPIHFLKELSISDIMIDRENNIWLCSLQKGVFKSINKNIVDNYSENDNVCNFSKNNETLYIGFTSKKEIKVDKNDSVFYSIIHAKELPPASLLTYFLESDLYSYYGTNTDLFYFENQKCTVIKEHKTNKNLNIPSRKIIKLGKDSFAITSYMNLYFINKQKIICIKTPPFIVKSIIQLKNKILLIGSRNSDGIYQYKNNEFTPYLKEYPQLKTRINDMKEDSSGNLWIATNEKGLFCYSNNKLYEFNQKAGLNSNKINEIDIDKKGNVWIATNIGLNKITTNNGLEKAMIYGFNNSHGLPNLEIEHVTIFNNKVWCSTKEHLFYFDRDKMAPNNVPPFTYLKSVSINDSSVKVSISPVLKYNQNNITFEFIGITYKNMEKKEFVYKLNGYDSEWESSTTGQCQYTNLPYGNYTFQVYALNNDKIKSILPATFSFSILKPFWLTWWFITTEIILLIVFVYLIIRWRINKIKKNEEEKTQINQKLAEFQMTAVRAQMNPHFVFNAISSIQHYILTNDKYNSYDYLAKFSHLIRNVLDNSQKEYISLEKEIITLSLYIELEKIRFRVPFEFSMKIDKELDQTEIFIPTMIIQPYIENAIWHGLMPKKNGCLLELEIKKNDSNLHIKIKDNGLGREASKNTSKGHVSKAMGLMEQRLKALSVKNNASFTVKIIDLKDENGKSLGTEANISMPLLFD